MVLARVMVLAHVMVLACVIWVFLCFGAVGTKAEDPILAPTSLHCIYISFTENGEYKR